MKRRILCVVALGLLASHVSAQVQIGQVDDFEDGTTQGWFESRGAAVSPNPPTNVPTDGPAGANDNYMSDVSAGGAGAGSRAVIQNISQWSGNYIAAGVTRIRMDIRNAGATTLHLRVGFQVDPNQRVVSAQTIEVPPDDIWRSITFDISEPSMATIGAMTYTQIMSAVDELRIFSRQFSLGWAGDSLAATIEVDNITALAAAMPPIADAGPPQFIFDNRNDGMEEVTLDGSGSSDPDGNIVSYDWQENGQSIAMGVNPTVTLTRGVHVITLIVMDNNGEGAETTVTITVEVGGIVHLPDLDTNGIREAAGFTLNGNGTMDVQINDPQTGAFIRQITYLSNNFTPFEIAALEGLSAGSGTAVALLAERVTDGLPIIQVNDANDGSLVANVFPWSTAWQLVDLLVVPDAGNNGNDALAVLAIRKADGLMAVEFRDPVDGTRIRLVFPLGLGWTAREFGLANINGVTALAVLAVRDADSLTIVQVVNATTGALVRNVFPLGFGWSPEELQVLPDTDGDGIDEIAVRMTRDADGLEIIQIRNAQTAAFLRNVFPIGAGGGGWTTRRFLAINNNGAPALGILSTRDSDGQMLLQLINTATGAILRNIFFLGPAFGPVFYASLPDFSGDNVDEQAILSRNRADFSRLIQVRNGGDGAVIRNLTIVP